MRESADQSPPHGTGVDAAHDLGTHKTRWLGLFPGLLCIGGVAASVAFVLSLVVDLPLLCLPFAALAVYCLRTTLRLAPGELPVLARTERLPTDSMTRLGYIAVGVAVLLAGWCAIQLYQEPYIDWGMLLALSALGLAWCGEWWLRGQTPLQRLRHSVSLALSRRTEIGFVLLLTLGGLLFRLWIIVQYPFLHGMETDEVLTAISALNLAHSTTLWPLYDISTGSVSFFQPIALSFRLFGASILALRAPMAVLSTLLIPAFYVLARQYAATPSALCATSLLAFAYWPALLGSFAFGWITGAVFFALGIGLLAFATRRLRFTAAAAGGACVAMTLYTYAVGRYLPLPAFIFLVPVVFAKSRPLPVRLGLLCSFVMGFIVVAAPFVGTVSRNSALFYVNLTDKTSDFQSNFKLHPLDATGSLAGRGRTIDGYGACNAKASRWLYHSSCHAWRSPGRADRGARGTRTALRPATLVASPKPGDPRHPRVGVGRCRERPTSLARHIPPGRHHSCAVPGSYVRTGPGLFGAVSVTEGPTVGHSRIVDHQYTWGWHEHAANHRATHRLRAYDLRISTVIRGGRSGCADRAARAIDRPEASVFHCQSLLSELARHMVVPHTRATGAKSNFRPSEQPSAMGGHGTVQFSATGRGRDGRALLAAQAWPGSNRHNLHNHAWRRELFDPTHPAHLSRGKDSDLEECIVPGVRCDHLHAHGRTACSSVIVGRAGCGTGLYGQNL